ncbi:hypothetical protein [Sporosarcina cascadiensis]|uniref:hypothetical protein n=1 Tax=Sporosarcina cascadiensis TaxID=2660747 RepID=UPI00129A6E65|nr:hypothetical protein [Sporosarcina cascadiensis]
MPYAVRLLAKDSAACQKEASRMIMAPDQALIAQPQSLMHTGQVIISTPVVIIEPASALIAAPQLRLRRCWRMYIMLLVGKSRV